MYPLAPQPEWIAWGTLPFFVNIPCKVIQQFWTLFYTLMYATPPARWIIIQVSLRCHKPAAPPPLNSHRTRRRFRHFMSLSSSR